MVFLPVAEAELDEPTRARFVVEGGLCIGCGLCHERAPDNLEIDDAEMCARVIKQPTSKAEEEACTTASEYCPTGDLRPVAPKGSQAIPRSPAPGTLEPSAR